MRPTVETAEGPPRMASLRSEVRVRILTLFEMRRGVPVLVKHETDSRVLKYWFQIGRPWKK
jgi:hypothetical protein